MTCHVSILTAAGRGAIACIAIEGARSTALVARHFQPLRPRPTLDATPVGGVRVGVWGESETGEELVVARVDRDRWEVHCHGGEAAVARIIEDLEAAGAQRREATEWLAERASDELAQSALVLLPHALTERAAGVLLDQYRGALREALQSVLQHMEAERLDVARERIDRLMSFWPVGSHLTQPWRIAISGPPNVGKSSLLNRLLGYDRAIVHDQPGTTRDVLRAATAIGGWPVELADTAGVRETQHAVEAAGIARAHSTARTADLVLLVNDVLDDQPFRDVVTAPSPPKYLYVLNKIDRLPGCCHACGAWLPTSALTGAGIDDLLQAIERQLVPTPPARGEAVPIAERQVAVLQQVRGALDANDIATAHNQLAKLLA